MQALREIDPYASDKIAERKTAKQLCSQLNALPADKMKARKPIYQALFGKVSSAYIEPNFFCDYGKNIFLGEKFYANHNCVILDAGEVHIGDRVLFGPNVQIYTVTHPINAEERATGKEFCADIHIGDDCWIGGGAIILPGVRIGSRSVIGAGAVVTHDIPEDSVAVGNPAKVVRKINTQHTPTGT